MSELNYEHVFDVLVDKTAEYVTENNLKAMVLGISGGIDSTVVAAICHEVSNLWKTEVYGLANYLQDHYKSKALEALRNDYKETCDNYKAMSCAIYNSCKLVPTDGLGISNSDLDQIGAKDYATVDDILSRFIPFENFRKSYDSAGQIMHPHDEMAESDCWSQLCARHGEDVVNKVWSRHLASEFKRKKAPIYISRELYE